MLNCFQVKNAKFFLDLALAFSNANDLKENQKEGDGSDSEKKKEGQRKEKDRKSWVSGSCLYNIIKN